MRKAFHSLQLAAFVTIAHLAIGMAMSEFWCIARKVVASVCCFTDSL